MTPDVPMRAPHPAAVTDTARAAAPLATPTTREPRWQVRLLGAVEVFDGVQRIERFPSRAVAALLARVALAPERAHAREELVELLWPGVALAVGRNRLRQVLSTLKSLLEPAGVPGAAVLQADRLAVRAVRGALGCDALDFERLARAGRAAEAHALYRGELMPGFYDEWIDAERQRLAALHGRLAPGLHNTPAAPDAPAAADVPHAPHAPQAAAAVHAARTAAAAPLLLPTYLTRLFGVDIAAARLRALVLGGRLVTLLGPGGSGKTRLGVEVAQALAPPPWSDDDASAGAAQRFDRIAFVALVGCGDLPQTLLAVARALQLKGADNSVAGLAAALAGQRVLLVLDNFEQLVGCAGAALAELLALLPALHLLVTSRRALGLDGEVCVSADPLELPAAGAGLAAAAANPAVALFVDRARAARADFHLGERNHAAVAALVRALAGLPLAIELAASRVRSFAPAEMVAMLSHAGGAGDAGAAAPHLALLARGGPRSGHDPRHASMAQVIDWSWRLLDARAQAVLGALAVFAVDATAAAVAAVAGIDSASICDDSLDNDGLGRVGRGDGGFDNEGLGNHTAWQLDALVGHSLVRCAPGDGEGRARFGLVEPVREFVAARLPAATAQRQRQRLRDWLVAWARGLPPGAAPARVAPELAQVHAVLVGAAADGAPHDALQLALALRSYWDTDGMPAHVQAALADALAATTPAGAAGAALHADIHELLAYLRFEAGFVAAAAEHADAALAAAPDPARRARAMVRRAWVELAAGRGEDSAGPGHARVQAWLDEALALARNCGDREAQARALHQLAVQASHLRGDPRRTEALLEQSQALWLALGDSRKAHARLRNRAQCWAQMGRQADALVAYGLCEQAARDEGDWVGQIDSLLLLGTLLAQQRQWQAALDANRRCVALCWQRWHRHGLAYALWNPPRLLARLRRPEPAIRLMAFAATFWAERFGPLGAADRREVRRVRALVRAQIGSARTEALWLQGAALDVASAVALALAE